MDELEKLKKENARLVEELKRLYGVERPFICGTAGRVDADGMNEFILVCPSYFLVNHGFSCFSSNLLIN